MEQHRNVLFWQEENRGRNSSFLIHFEQPFPDQTLNEFFVYVNQDD